MTLGTFGMGKRWCSADHGARGRRSNPGDPQSSIGAGELLRRPTPAVGGVWSRSDGDDGAGRTRAAGPAQRARGTRPDAEGCKQGRRRRVLVVHGERASARPRCWSTRSRRRTGFALLRTLGVEGEMELPFAALQQLCAPILELTRASPGAPARGTRGGVRTQRRSGAEPVPGRTGGSRPAVGGRRGAAAPVCRRRRAVARRASARALAFVARRLLAERIALVFAAREPGDALAGLPELQVEPLGHRDSRTLLESVLPARLDEHVLERIVAETRGNPLALLELPRGLTPAQLAGGFGLPAAVPVVGEHRGELHAEAGQPAGRRAAAVAGGGGGSGRRHGTRLAGGAAARNPRVGCGNRRGGRAVGARCPGGLPPSTGSLGCLSGGRAQGASRRPPSAGGGDRSAARSGSPRVAPGAGGIDARRGRRRRARALGRTGAGARRTGGRRCLPRARRGAHTRVHAPRAAPARGRRREARCRRSGGRAGAAGGRRGRCARRAGARPGRPVASPDRDGAAARRRRRPPVSERGEPPRATRPRAGPRDVPRGARGRDGQRRRSRRRRAGGRRRRAGGATRRRFRHGRSTCCSTRSRSA